MSLMLLVVLAGAAAIGLMVLSGMSGGSSGSSGSSRSHGPSADALIKPPAESPKPRGPAIQTAPKQVKRFDDRAWRALREGLSEGEGSLSAGDLRRLSPDTRLVVSTFEVGGAPPMRLEGERLHLDQLHSVELIMQLEDIYERPLSEAQAELLPEWTLGEMIAFMEREA
jgi:hypothetical protein